MLVKMSVTKRGYEKQHSKVSEYSAGETYDIEAALAEVFVNNNWAIDLSKQDDIEIGFFNSDVEVEDHDTNKLSQDDNSDTNDIEVVKARGRKKGTK